MIISIFLYLQRFGPCLTVLDENVKVVQIKIYTMQDRTTDYFEIGNKSPLIHNQETKNTKEMSVSYAEEELNWVAVSASKTCFGFSPILSQF